MQHTDVCKHTYSFYHYCSVTCSINNGKTLVCEQELNLDNLVQFTLAAAGYVPKLDLYDVNIPYVNKSC